jgi:hypothetical protein
MHIILVLFTVTKTLCDVVFPIMLLKVGPEQSQDSMAKGFPFVTVHINVTFVSTMMGPCGICCILGILLGASITYNKVIHLIQVRSYFVSSSGKADLHQL